MKKLSLFFLIAVIILASCDKREVELKVDPVLPSESGIVGMIYAGNTSCDELAGTFVASTGKIDFVNGSFVFEPGSGWPQGLEVTVSEDGRYISFTLPATSPYCVGAVIAKGGNASNVFTYSPGVKSDEGLTCPVNSSGSPAQLSNLTFCFVECPPPPPANVIAFKAYLNTGWTCTGGGPENSYYIGYNNFTPGVNSLWYWGKYPTPANGPELAGTSTGNITVQDFDLDGIMDVKVDNTGNPANKFESCYLYVGTLEGFNTDYLNYPFKLPLWTSPKSTITFFGPDFTRVFTE